jgi:hypothetical protein
MPVVQLAPRAPSRWLWVSLAAAAAALAWRAHRRPAAPTPPTACVIQSVPATPVTEPIDQLESPRPHFAVPPPGDPYPRPDLNPPDTGPTTVQAELISRDDHAPACGTFAVWSVATFRPLVMGGEGDLRVLVQCAELLQPHETYRLKLTRADDVPDGKNDVLWRASRVDREIIY